MVVDWEITDLIYVKIAQFKGSEYGFYIFKQSKGAKGKTFWAMQEFPFDKVQSQQKMPCVIFLDSWLRFKEASIQIFSLESNNMFEKKTVENHP